MLAFRYRHDIVEDLGLSFLHPRHLLLDAVDAHIEMKAIFALGLVEDEIAGPKVWHKISPLNSQLAVTSVWSGKEKKLSKQ
jgi:hypothetical protein